MSRKNSSGSFSGRRRMRAGLSMIELLLVVAILGSLAALIIPRIAESSDKAKETADEYNIALLNTAVERWYMDKGDWPALDLSDIGADPNYLPEGIPDSPWTGNSYRLRFSDHRVTSAGGK